MYILPFLTSVCWRKREEYGLKENRPRGSHISVFWHVPPASAQSLYPAQESWVLHVISWCTLADWRNFSNSVWMYIPHLIGLQNLQFVPTFILNKGFFILLSKTSLCCFRTYTHVCVVINECEELYSLPPSDGAFIFLHTSLRWEDFQKTWWRRP